MNFRYKIFFLVVFFRSFLGTSQDQIQKLVLTDSVIQIEQTVFYKAPIIFIDDIKSLRKALRSYKLVRVKNKGFKNWSYYVLDSGIEFLFSSRKKGLNNMTIYYRADGLEDELKTKVNTYHGKLNINGLNIHSNLTRSEIKSYMSSHTNCKINSPVPLIEHVDLCKVMYDFVFENEKDNAKISNILITW